MPRSLRFMGIHIDHPEARERARGVASTTSLAVVSEDLKVQPVHKLPLTEDELVKLIRDAPSILATLRGVQ